MVLRITKKSPMIIAPCIPNLDQAIKTGGIAAIIIPKYGINPKKNVNNPHSNAKLMSKTKSINETLIP